MEEYRIRYVTNKLDWSDVLAETKEDAIEFFNQTVENCFSIVEVEKKNRKEVINMVVITKNQKNGLTRTCFDCKHIILNVGTDFTDYHRCGLWYDLYQQLKDLPNVINDIPKWCPFK